MSETEEVYTYIDPCALPLLDVASARIADVALGVVRENDGIGREFLRFAPEFIDDPDKTGLFVGLKTAVYKSPAPFVVSMEAATLVGYRTILGHGMFFNDETYADGGAGYLERLAMSDPFPNEDTGLLNGGPTAQFRLGNSNRKRVEIDETVISLNSTEPSNYGSFIFRVLPKVVALKKLGLMDLPMLAYLNHSSYAQMLELCGVRSDNLISYNTTAITCVKRVVVPSLRNPNAFLDYESRDLFRACSHKLCGDTGRGRRIYISRFSHGQKANSKRVMINEGELIERLAALGIEIFEPEKVGAVDQVRAFASAEMIIGPSGAAMFNTVFCRPGTKIIDIESEPHWIYAHSGLFASSELRYGIFIGRTDPNDEALVHKRWSVDIDSLIDRVCWFL